MPHVEIKCFSGRTEEQKRQCAEKVAEDISAILGCEVSSVSVVIKDIDEKDWGKKVWNKNIIVDKDYLYKKPGYTCD